MDHNSHSHGVDDGDALTTMAAIQDQHREGMLGGDHETHMPQFLDGISQGEENQLLEMLHVPILHGGMKEVILLSSLTTASAGSFTLACLVLVVLVVLLELLRLLAWWVEKQYSGAGSSKMSPAVCGCKQCNSLTASVGERKQYDAIHDSSSLPMGESSTDHLNTSSSHTPSTSGWMAWACVGGLQFLLYFISTLFMLIAMTMNIYLIISLAVGSAIGKMTAIYVKKKLMSAHN